MSNHSEDDNPAPRKRQRVAKACNRCRHSKLRCDGVRPSCQKCLAAKRNCSYGAPLKKRGLRTGYVRALECLWGLTFSSIQGSADTVQQLILSRPGWSSWVRDDVDDSQGENDPISTWRTSGIPQIIDSLLAPDGEKEGGGLGLPADSEEPSVESLSWGPQSIQVVPQMLTQSDIPGEQSHSGGHEVENGDIGPEQPRTTSPSSFRSAPAGTLHSMGLSNASAQPSVQRPDLPRNAQALLHQFFSSTHPWIPIFHRHTVLRTLFQYRQQSANTEDPSSWRTGENALLWAILAHATIGESVSKSTSTSLTQCMPDFPHSRYRIARNMMLGEDEDQYTASHVQALLALALVQYSFREWSRAGLMIGQAVLVARHIGLDQSFLTTEVQQRTWLGCFALDTLISLHTGQRPLLPSCQIRDLLPLNATSSEEWEPWDLQHARLPEVDFQLAEYEEPTYTTSVFSLQLEVLCMINEWICSKPDEDSLEVNKAAFLWWEKRLPLHIKAYQNTHHEHPTTPLNVTQLQVLQAFLCARLWHSQALDWSEDLRRVWLVALESMQRLLKIFHGAVLPPSCNLIRSVSLPGSQSESMSFQALVQHLRADAGPEGPMINEGPYSTGELKKLDDLLTMSTLVQADGEALTSYSLDPRIQQNFTSFMGASQSFAQPTVSNLMLNQMDLQDLDSTTTMFMNQAEGTDRSEDVPFGFLSSLEAVDIDERDQFQKNLGFTL
ncbi:hypothetical protein V2G26_018081 [Clonostachys chloroleuca]